MSRRIDRWNNVETRLNAVGIEPTRWEALDAKTLLWTQYRPYFACAVSHLMVLNHAKQMQYDRILVLEDDVCPFRNFQELFSTFLVEEAKLKWDIFYLGFIPVSHDSSYWSYELIEKDKINNNVYKASKHISGAYAYAMKKDFIKTMLETYGNKGVHQGFTVDSYLQKHYLDQSQTAFAFVPQLFAHDNSLSDNTGLTENRMARSTWLTSPDNYIENLTQLEYHKIYHEKRKTGRILC